MSIYFFYRWHILYNNNIIKKEEKGTGTSCSTPRRPFSAFARFFLKNNGLALDVRGSARQICPCNAISTGNGFSGLQSFLYVQAPIPRGGTIPQVAPTAKAKLQGSQAVYTTHSPVGYLPRGVVSLRIRHEHLIRLDFHQLDCSLVGCSDVRSISLFGDMGSRGHPKIMTFRQKKNFGSLS